MAERYFLHLAEQGTYRPHWSNDVMEELGRNLGENLNLSADRVRRRIDAMNTAFEDAMVTGYSALIPAMTCDEKDRHVLAAAVVSECQLIVTFNIKDFPPTSTEPFQIGVVTPDCFLQDQLDLYPSKFAQAMDEAAHATSRPPLTRDDIIDSLEKSGLREFARNARGRLL